MTVDDVLGALRDLSHPVQLLNETAETAESRPHTPTAARQRQDSRDQQGP
jgi:hypothetical protein